jgi:hypothetical protein
MIDNRTENKNYPLPHPENIASQDVGRIAEAIEMVDADINSCSTAIDGIVETVEELNAKSLRIPSSLVGTVNTELLDLEPRRYIVVNDDATGFSTVEGGGGEGGLMGEVLAKRSNFNFDTMWVDPRAISKKAAFVNEIDSDCQLKNNNTVILADDIEIDNSDQLPRVGLTQRQVISDAIADSSYTYIICDEIDESALDESDIATREKFGRVMIGDGINNDNGKISVPAPLKASKTEFGIVKIGSGIDVDDGVISTPSYQQADHENFGTVKLSSDFKTGNSGELLLANKKDVEEIVYQAANVDIVRNKCIIPKSNFAKYRLFINEDSLISLDWSQILIEKDMAFDLEIISDATYVISFEANIIWTLPCAGVSAGKTLIHFERKFGSTTLYGTLKEADTTFFVDLTTIENEDVQTNFVCKSNGFGVNPCEVFSKREGNWSWSFVHFTTGTGEAIWQVDFMRSTLINSLQLSAASDAFLFFYVEGSVDGRNWTHLYSDENVVFPEGHLYLTKRGFFRHYRIRCSKVGIRWFRFWGYSVEDEIFELVKIMPFMPDTNSLNGFSITSTGVNDGALYRLTQNTTDNFANFSARVDGEFWIKYELPEAAVVNFIDIAAPRGYSDRMPIWFKVEASNDDENWTLLLERASLLRWYDGESRQYYIDNHTAYKFYKFTPIEIPSTEFRMARFRLYRKEDGRGIIHGYIPILSAASQGGYEITFSSEASGDRGYYAFDGNDSSQWTTTSGNAQNSWICIKFPTETVCNAVLLKARSDQYYYQAATSFEIQGSNDGSVFSTLKTATATWIQGEEKIVEFFNDVAFLYYRIFINTVQSGDYAGFATINFGTARREYKRDVTVKEFLLPIMTANSQDGYEISANSEHSSGWEIWRAFDRNTGTSWSTAYDSPEATIIISMPTAKICNLISVYPRSGILNQAFGSFSLYGSSDGDSWTELLTVSDISAWSNNVEKSWEVENDLAFPRYKIVATPINGENCVSVNNLNLFHKHTTREY